MKGTSVMEGVITSIHNDPGVYKGVELSGALNRESQSQSRLLDDYGAEFKEKSDTVDGIKGLL